MKENFVEPNERGQACSRLAMKQTVASAISNSGVVPIRPLPVHFLNPFQSFEDVNPKAP